jgi:3-hydroxybutyryl-CoA dehydrogenase
MGAGVAECLARAHLQVILVDLTKELLQRADSEIDRSVRFQSLVAGSGQKMPIEEIRPRIRFSCDLSELAGAGFLIENITERWPAKEALYQKLNQICPPHAILAANTSAIPITQIAGAITHPERVIGMHFMNPVALKPTVEVIRGRCTSDDTVACTRALLARMGKEGIVVRDSPGFVTNRVLMLMINEAIFLLDERVASVEDIDRIFRECFGHKMGPLETADLIGLDTILLSIEALWEAFRDSKYRPCPLLRQMVHSHLLGRKSGEGFYQYSDRARAPLEKAAAI